MSESNQKDESETDKTQLIISKLVRFSSTANDKYPSGTDYRYFCSYPSFTEQSNNLSNNVLTLLIKLCNFVSPNNNNQIDLLSETNEYLRWQTISDSADYCMEQVDICLDEIKEETHNPSISNNYNSNHSNLHSSKIKKQNKLFPNITTNSLDLLYPQASFLDSIDNNRNMPFKPNLINDKKELQLITEDNIKYYSHPYINELNNISYSKTQFEYFKGENELIVPQAVQHSLFYWINNENTLSEMCDYISTHCNVMAIDLEHHSKYTFYGMTCLIQISIGNGNDIRDYIIDTLALRSLIHIYLNPIFTNENIIKIFHGCINDIQWLQRDFSVYVINVFDTYEAAKLLNLREKSLKYLLLKFCNVQTNKYLRKSDWRIRPLTPQLIEYARKDTHYLLYLYKYLSNKLIDKSTVNVNLLKECYNNSAQMCKIIYKKPYFNVNGWKELCQYNGWYFINNKSLNVLSKLYEWRDRIGRKLDQSIACVLSNKILKQICNDLPTDSYSLNTYNLSLIAREYSNDILDIIKGCMNDNSNKIDVMFEVQDNNEKETHLKGNNGCFSDMINDKNSMKIMDVNMINMSKNRAEKATFFPMDNGNDSSGKCIVESVFNEMENMPVFMEKYNMNKKKKKKGKVNNKSKNKSKATNLIQKLKKNNFDSVANANDRGKIFGSKYLDRNSKKNVFRLPRDNNSNVNKKRKGDEMDVNISGPVLEDLQPKKKKMKLSKSERKEKRLAKSKQEERMNKVNLVNNEWPMDEQNRNMHESKEMKKNVNNRNRNKNVNDKCEDNDDDDVEITESDILDAAPVAVLDTKFNDVYDPFKQ